MARKRCRAQEQSVAVASLPTKKSYLISCEGKNTERDMIDQIARSLGLNVEVVNPKYKHTDPSGLITDLNNHKRKNPSKVYDELWVVFDRDEQHQDYLTVIRDLSDPQKHKNLAAKIQDYICDKNIVQLEVTPRDKVFLAQCLNYKELDIFKRALNQLLSGINYRCSADILDQLSNLIKSEMFLNGLSGYSNSIYYAASNPSYEIWILLHLMYTARAFNNSDEIIEQIKEIDGWSNYSKKGSITDTLFSKCSDSSSNALIHSKRLYKFQKKDASPDDTVDLMSKVPITTFSLLFFELTFREWVKLSNFDETASYCDYSRQCYVKVLESKYSFTIIKFYFKGHSEAESFVTEEIFNKAITSIQRIKYFGEYEIQLEDQNTVKYLRS